MRLRPLPSLPVHRPSVQVAPDNFVPHVVDIVRLPPPHAFPSTGDVSILSDYRAASVYDRRSIFEELVNSEPSLVTPEPSLCSVPVHAECSITEIPTTDYSSDPGVQMPIHFEYGVPIASPVTLPTRPTPTRIPQILKFNENGEFSGLLYYSPHSVAYQDELYPTALHLFEARKFVDHRPDLAERIRFCGRIEEVTTVSAEFAEFMRRDWNNVALGIVSTGFFVSRYVLADRLVGAGYGDVYA